MSDTSINDSGLATSTPASLTTRAKKLIDDYLFMRVLWLLGLITVFGSAGVYSFLSRIEARIVSQVTDTVLEETEDWKRQTVLNAAEARIKLERNYSVIPGEAWGTTLEGQDQGGEELGGLLA